MKGHLIRAKDAPNRRKAYCIQKTLFELGSIQTLTEFKRENVCFTLGEKLANLAYRPGKTNILQNRESVSGRIWVLDATRMGSCVVSYGSWIWQAFFFCGSSVVLNESVSNEIRVNFDTLRTLFENFLSLIEKGLLPYHDIIHTDKASENTLDRFINYVHEKDILLSTVFGTARGNQTMESSQNRLKLECCFVFFDVWTLKKSKNSLRYIFNKLFPRKEYPNYHKLSYRRRASTKEIRDAFFELPEF